MKPEVLIRVPFPAESIRALEEEYVVHYAPTAAEFELALPKHGTAARGIIANGSIGLTADHIRALPKVEIIQTVGVGVENIDRASVEARGIVLANNSGVNGFTVAEHAVALLLSLLRDVPTADRATRAGVWNEGRQPRPLVYRKRVGILGLGEIGQMIATRLLGFQTEILYHNRKPVPGCDYRYCSSALELAQESDVVIVAAPGGAATRHLINREALEALGPNGVLINVGRGSVVDTTALVTALQNNLIAGAALDVWENEPVLTPELLAAPRLILSPHIGGRSPEAEVFAREQIAANLRAHFLGKGQILNRIA